VSAVDRLNRTLLTVLGLLLLAAGALGLALGWGAFGDDLAGDPVLGPAIEDFVARSEPWFWPLCALAALVLAYLGYRWLRAQLGFTPAKDSLGWQEEEQGYTRVRAGAATDALAADIEGQRGVRSASARLLDTGPEGELALQVDLHDDASVGGVRAYLEQQALPRFDSALEAESLPAHARLTLKPPAGRALE
jgi:hypothetical protein